MGASQPSAVVVPATNIVTPTPYGNSAYLQPSTMTNLVVPIQHTEVVTTTVVQPAILAPPPPIIVGNPNQQCCQCCNSFFCGRD